jgi:DNA-binding PadR family transcriptional regulator
MRHRHRHGCGPRPNIHIDLPEGLFAMRGGGRGFRFGPGGFDFNFGDDSGWGGQRGRNRKRMFESGQLRLVLLKLIADEPCHGYDLIRAIEELTGGSYVPSPGMVYPTLTMLDEMGHIAEAKSEGARKSFAVTPDGSVHLAERKAEVEALFARLAELASQQERTDAAPVRRAMNGLREALIHRLGRGGVQKQTVHDAVAIIDEAVRKIERL